MAQNRKRWLLRVLKIIGQVILVAMLGAFVLLLISVIIKPTYLVELDIKGFSLTDSERVKLYDQYRKTAIQLLGGVVLSVGLYMTWRRIRAMEKQAKVSQESILLTRETMQLTEQGQVTERFTKAIEQLGSDNLSIRLGGIFSLERIAKDSVKDHWTVMEVLSAFIRENAPKVEMAENDGGEEAKNASTKVSADIQAALTVIGRRIKENDIGGEGINLVGTDLRWGNLYKANLGKAALFKADLREAILYKADLAEALLRGGDLRKTNLEGADLRSAFLYEVDLREANLSRANLTEANLRKADLRKANLSGADFREAFLNEADLRGAFFGWANFYQAELIDADLRESHLSNANWEEADLSRANLYQTSWILRAPVSPGDSDKVQELYENRLNLRKAILYGSDLRKADLGGADLAGADLSGADLRGTDLRQACLTGTNLKRAKLQGADLRWTDSTGIYLYKPNSIDDIIKEENISRVVFKKADSTGAELMETDFGEADMRGVNLEGADLFRANLRKVFAYKSQRQQFLDAGVKEEMLNQMIWEDDPEEDEK